MDALEFAQKTLGFIGDKPQPKKKNKLEVLDIINQMDDDFTGLQPFVFTKVNKEPKDDEFEIEHDLVIASPFELFSIEVDHGAMTVSHRSEKVNLDTLAMICKEHTPRLYTFWLKCHGLNANGSAGKDIYLKIDPHMEMWVKGVDVGEVNKADYQAFYDFCMSLTSHYLERLQSEKIGEFSASGKAKYKSADGRKQTYKPTNVIYISDKKITGKTRAVNNAPVRHTESWVVRAHWRRLHNEDSLGLDRYGNRTVKGLTWIKPHNKGQGEAEMKIRKVTR